MMKVPQKESRTLEFKSQINEFHQIAKTVIAFANDIGGEIWIGVNDQRRVVGLSDTAIERLHEDLPRSMFDAIQPMVPLELAERNIGGKAILIVRVFSGPQKPYYLSKEGLPKGVHVRVGSSTMRAKQMQLDELHLVQRHTSYDQTVIPDVSLAELDPVLLKQVYPTLRTSAMEADGVLKRHPLSKELQLTVAGILMFHPEASNVIPEAYTNISRYRGDDPKQPIASMDIMGPLPVQLEETMAELAKYLERDYKLKGAKLKPTSWEIPERSLREVIANALFHRKYHLPASTRVGVFPDRIEVFSPGNFPGPMDLENLGDGTSYIRNLHVCRIARKLGLIERRGTGIRIILDAAKESDLKMPQFVEGADFVKVFLFSEPAKPKTEPWDVAQELIQQQGFVTARQIAGSLEVSKVTSLKLIKQWIDKGLLLKKGRGPTSRYVLRDY